MKTSALLVFLVCSVTCSSAEPVVLKSTAGTPASRTESGVVGPKDAQKKEEKKTTKEKEPVIPGITLTRPDGSLLGFEVLGGGQIKLSFYDKKKKPMPVNVDRGLARWANPRGNGQLTTPLNPSATVLLGAKPALPPYNYNISINLLVGEGEAAKAVESYVINYRG